MVGARQTRTGPLSSASSLRSCILPCAKSEKCFFLVFWRAWGYDMCAVGIYRDQSSGHRGAHQAARAAHMSSAY